VKAAGWISGESVSYESKTAADSVQGLNSPACHRLARETLPETSKNREKQDIKNSSPTAKTII
jgi:hypothetical protein